MVTLHPLLKLLLRLFDKVQRDEGGFNVLQAS